MNFFGFFIRKKTSNAPVTIPADRIDDILSTFERSDKTDYLGLAAKAGHKGKAAIQSKRYNDAWRHYHEQKEYYLKHAARSEFTFEQTRGLEGSVSDSLANILRLEGKHDQALIHLLYCIASSSRPSKAQEKKLAAYVNRAKLDVSLDEVHQYLRKAPQNADLRAIQSTVSGWRKGS